MNVVIRCALIALVLSSVLLTFVVPFLRRIGRLDRPNERSSHLVPTPRGAGLALWPAVAASVAFGPTQPIAWWWAISTMPAIGALDDLWGFSARRRLATQVIVAIVLAAALVRTGVTSPVSAAVLLGEVLSLSAFIVVIVNAVNFVDGINGLLGMCATIWGTYYLLLSSIRGVEQTAVTACVLLAVSISFLPWNTPRARVFLGDSGSYLIGITVAWLAIATFHISILVALSPLSTMLFDVSATALRRIRLGHNLFIPHRDHVYERLASGGLGHTRTAALVALFTALSCLIGLIDCLNSITATLVSAILLIACNLVYLALPRFTLKRRTQ